jgi:peroxiredoxin
MEKEETVKSWAIERHKFTFPVLLDTAGEVSARYAPDGVLPDLPRQEIPIASNLIVDKQGKIQFYSLLDSKNFDARLIELTKHLEQLGG